MYSGTDLTPKNQTILMEWSVDGHVQGITALSRSIFTSKSGVLTLLDLDPNSIVRIDKPILKQSIAYYFKK